MIFTLLEQIILFVLILFTLVSFTAELYKKYKIINKGTGNFSFDHLSIRLKRVFVEFVLQKKVLSQSSGGTRTNLEEADGQTLSGDEHDLSIGATRRTREDRTGGHRHDPVC